MNLELGLTVQHMTIKNTVSFVLVQMITTSGKAIFKNSGTLSYIVLKEERP